MHVQVACDRCGRWFLSPAGSPETCPECAPAGAKRVHPPLPLRLNCNVDRVAVYGTGEREPPTFAEADAARMLLAHADLLAACKRALDWFRIDRNAGNLNEDAYHVRRLPLLAAVAKAEGKQ
jgi:hypothetical protein